MPECVYINRIPNMPWVLSMSKFWRWQSSEYGRVLNMWALHSVLNMPEYALNKFWIYLGFYICQDSEYWRVLNMQELHRALNMPQYGWICQNRTWICLNISEFTIIDSVLNMYYRKESPLSLPPPSPSSPWICLNLLENVY